MPQTLDNDTDASRTLTGEHAGDGGGDVHLAEPLECGRVEQPDGGRVVETQPHAELAAGQRLDGRVPPTAHSHRLLRRSPQVSTGQCGPAKDDTDRHSSAQATTGQHKSTQVGAGQHKSA